MSDFVSAYSDSEGNTVVSVSRAFAESAGLTVLKQDATDSRGRPLPPREGNRKSGATKKAAAKKTAAKKTAAPRAAAKTTAPAAANSSTPPTGGEAASKPEEGSK